MFVVVSVSPIEVFFLETNAIVHIKRANYANFVSSQWTYKGAGRRLRAQEQGGGGWILANKATSQTVPLQERVQARLEYMAW